MTVCAGPVYPASTYLTPRHGLMAHYINEVKGQVYTELRSQRASHLSSQKSDHGVYVHSPRYSRAHSTSPAKKSDSSPWTTEPQIPFPTPQIIAFPSVPPRPTPQIPTTSNPFSPAWVPYSLPQPQIHFPTPEPYGAGTPVSYSNPLLNNSSNAPTKSSPVHARQGPAQVIPFPDSDESMPLLSIYENLNASTYGRPSYSPVPSQKRRVKYTALSRAVENIKICKQETAGWVELIRQTRSEKLSTEEREITSRAEKMYQKATKAVRLALSALHTVHASQDIRRDAQFTSGKVAADISTLSALATSLRHELTRLVQHLKEVKASGSAKSPRFFSRLDDAPGCLAGLYLKKRLLRFASLSKAQRRYYSDSDSEAQTQSDHLPMSKLMSLLYSEVRRTYSTVSKTLASFESSLHTFRLELEKDHGYP